MNRPQATPESVVAALDRASERRTTPLGAGDLAWRIWGKGYPLVLLHGGTGSWMHWIRNIDDLSRNFMLVVPDLPGSGESANPEPPVSAQSVAAPLAAGIAAILGPNAGFAIAGFSMGGLIAGYVAHLAGARAECLVLVGSTGMELPRTPIKAMQSWRRLPTEQDKRDAHRKNLSILMIHDASKIDDLAIHVQSLNAGRSRIRGKHVSHTGSLARCLPEFAGKLAGIWGEFDATAAPYVDERRRMLQKIQPQSPFDVVPGAGHWVQFEAHEQFNRLLRAALKAVA